MICCFEIEYMQFNNYINTFIYNAVLFSQQFALIQISKKIYN